MMTPWPLATAVIAPIAGRLADRLVPALLGSAGLEQLGGEFRALQGGKTSWFNDKLSKFACSGDQVSFQKN